MATKVPMATKVLMATKVSMAKFKWKQKVQIEQKVTNWTLAVLASYEIWACFWLECCNLTSFSSWNLKIKFLEFWEQKSC